MQEHTKDHADGSPTGGPTNPHHATGLYHEIRYQDTTYPLAGATAVVETSGQILQRFTMTRLALLGPIGIALPKRKDRRELFITVEGEGFAFVLEVSPNQQLAARQFATHLATRGKEAMKSGVLPEPAVDSRPTTGASDALADLERARTLQLITEDEYNMKRQEILRRF